MRLRSVLLFGFALVGAASMVSDGRAQPLPQWLPVETLDKPFNDAAGDLKKPRRDVLELPSRRSVRGRCGFTA
jgi:hypothetical protein